MQQLQFMQQKTKIKFSLYSRHYAEACNERRDRSPRLSAGATQLRRSVPAVASRWRHFVRFDRVIEPQTSRTDSKALTTELIDHFRENVKT